MKHETLTIKVVTTTKKLVDSLLACNTNNRALRKSVVSAYARDMKNGKWRLTHQGIAVSKDGTLVDGQNRLEAIREAGYPPIEIVLFHGVDMETQKYVDQHAKRSMRDALKLSFDKDFARHAPAIARAIIGHRENASERHTIPTPDEIIDVVEDHATEIEAVCSKNRNKFFAASILSGFVIVAKSRHNSLDRVCDFIDDVQDGEMLNRSMPAFHLRNFVLQTKGGSAGQAMLKERLVKTIKATEAYLDGKTMGVLRA
jgi:hypothetical protein